jgi:tRNA modification GTPase
MTGKGTSAIATIQVFGPSALTLLARVFKPFGTGHASLVPGRTCLGSIVRKGTPIDQVILGCEGPDLFTIHCHGNPLIVKKTMELLEQHQVELISAEQMYCQVWRSQGLNTLAMEGRLALLRARTLQGTRIILRQMNEGLARTLCAWQEEMEPMPIGVIQEQGQSMLEQSEIAQRIIYGCQAVLVGPPNTGKSTLFNGLVGQDRAIVADVEGTTRDWIEACCRLDSLDLTLIDTAGLDQRLVTVSDVDRMSQHRTLDLLAQADLVILVLDASASPRQIEPTLMHKLQGKCVITVLNKSDLSPTLKPGDLPRTMDPVLEISAKQEIGVDKLKQEIRQILGINGFKLETAICFTERQRDLLAELQARCTRKQIQHFVNAMLKAPLNLA